MAEMMTAPGNRDRTAPAKPAIHDKYFGSRHVTII